MSVVPVEIYQLFSYDAEVTSIVPVQWVGGGGTLVESQTYSQYSSIEDWPFDVPAE